jgi:class 3 adenylate cyclase/alpha-beta hydrolase superfamily lysophospholipase
MEPRIQYAKTSDGVNIAYAVLGSGPAIVFPSGIWGSVHLYKAAATFLRERFDELASLGWSVITYDGRGSGASDRDVDDYTLDGKLRDLESVIAAAAPGRFALWASYHGGPPAIAYAIRSPHRVTNLVLSNTFANAAEYNELEPSQRLRDAIRDVESDWEFATLTFANAMAGYTDSKIARRSARAFREGMSAKGYMAFRDAADKIDVRDLLPQIRVPTLVIHSTRAYQQGIGLVTQRLARTIPNARFVQTGDLTRCLDEFLREGDSQADLPVPSGMTAILFADIAESTALTEKLGDAPFREKTRVLDGALRAIIREHAGAAIEGKLLGDGVLAVFTSARQAIEAALACGSAGDDAGLPLHLGLHAGDVIREDNNVYGGAVNIASRIAGLSVAGEVLVSETVRSLALTSGSASFEDRGRRKLKGVGEPVRIWTVRKAE